MNYIVSAGGTGGHIYPALSLINKIKEKDKNAKILYIGTTDRMEKDIVPNMGIDYLGISMHGASKNPKVLISFLVKLLSAKNKCIKTMKKFRPDVVIGFGGYVTIPVIMAAKKVGANVVLHEQNSIPGKANLSLSKYADLVCISMDSSGKYFKNSNVVLTGNPRSEDIAKVKKGNKKDYGLSSNKKLVLITMGSLGSASVNNLIVDALDKFKNKDYEVLLVTGNKNYDDVDKKNLPLNVKVVPYIENMGEVLKFTDLIVTRAGATIMAEITALGLPGILIPSPYVANNHQEVNAKDLESKGACQVILENDFDKDNFIKMIDEILTNKEMYDKMSKASKKVGITDSSTKIYEEIQKL